MNLRVGLLDGN